jgi:hypothetical protein
MSSNEFKNIYIPEAPQDLTNPEVLQQLSLGSVTTNLVSSTGSNTSSALRGTNSSGATDVQTYQVSGLGVGTFGDGSDGDVEISGTTTLTGDKYYNDLIIPAGTTLKPAGYRVFVAGTLTLNGTLERNGNPATYSSTQDWGTNDGSHGQGGAGASALADGYLKGSLAGGAGGSGGTGAGSTAGAGTAGGNTANSLGDNGTAGGRGGNTAASYGGAAGAGGTATTANTKLIANWHLATLLDVSSTGASVKYDNGAAGGGGGGGAETTGSKIGPGGGGAGSAGGILAIYAKNIVLGVTGSITANGGNGAKGGDGDSFGSAAGAGGGAGGNGGQIIIVYNTMTNNGTVAANGGTGGAAGQYYTGTAPVAGTSGAGGAIRFFQLSL